ncbi:unnamed protein product [Auanema sp. JU1783]|nr:unnamed protein product [Auanema sp. JU1783]
MAAARLWNKTEMLMNGSIRLSLYKSKRSKLMVAVGDVPGPVVNGSISFVTETENDDGLPHTLEHLVFMGSKKYPFKGVLDVIANRCLANGTNAYTDQDHTAYTLNTVGSEGFFKVLPVYINHLLTPILSDSQFTTEVHHINGEGINAGVVYSEMQDYESEMEDMMLKKQKELMYPAGNAYRADAYGRLKNLRDSCTNVKVRAFHEKFYHLSNMMVTVCGRLDHERLLAIMEQIEEEHLPNCPVDFPRPFNFELVAPTEAKTEKVVCPSDDDSRGIVDMAWFAHKPSDVITSVALEVLFDYMSNTPISPLQKDFVLLDDPLASSATFNVDEQNTCIIHLSFNGVPTPKLDEVAKKYLEKTVPELSDPSAFDMERMGFLIEQSIQSQIVQTESNAHSDIIAHLIGYQLFDKNDDDLLIKRMDPVAVLNDLRSKPASYWASLISDLFTKPAITVIGVPNEDLVQKVSDIEQARIESQKTKLGDDGLKKCGETLANAIHENTVNKASDEVLSQLIVENLENFDSFDVQKFSNRDSGKSSDHINAFLNQFKFPAYLHKCSSKFLELFFLIDTSSLTLEQRSYLLLFAELLFESPANIDGKTCSADEVAKLYTKDLVDHSIEVGISGVQDKLFNITLKVPANNKYTNLAKWAEIFTTGIIFDVERIKMCALKLVSEAKEQKRDGNCVAAAALCCLTYDENSNAHLYESIVLEKHHEKIAQMCTSNPSAVLAAMEDLRKALKLAGANVHFVGDIDAIDKSLFDPSKWEFVNNQNIPQYSVDVSDYVKEDKMGVEKVFTVGGSESSFIYQNSVIDVDWNSSDVIPTLLFSQYLSQTEGPLWRTIRGEGLAYGADIYVKPDRRVASLQLYRCAQPTQAFDQTRKLVMDIIAAGELDKSEFEAAKRSLVFGMMKKEATVSSTGKLSVVNTLRGVPLTFQRELCEQIWNANVKDVLERGGPKILTLFESPIRAISVHPQKLNEIKKGFSQIQSAPLTSLQYNGSTKRAHSGAKAQTKRRKLDNEF